MLDLPRFEFGLGDYSRTLERLAASVDPETAHDAAALHRAGMRRALAFASVLILAASLFAFPWATRSASLASSAFAVLLVATPVVAFHLAVFRRVAWAGRVLVPCLLLPLLFEAPTGGANAFFGGDAARIAALLAGAFLNGLLLDAGAGGFFAPRILETLLRLPLVFAPAAGFFLLSARTSAAPLAACWILAALLAAFSAVAFAARLSGRLLTDASRLARFASVRDGRRICGAVLAVLVLLPSALLALVAMGASERFDDAPARGRAVRMHLDPDRQQVLPLFDVPVEKGDPSAVEFSVFCDEAGGILTEEDIASGAFYDVPFVDLVDPGAPATVWPEGSPHRQLREWLLAFVGLAQTESEKEAEWFATIVRNDGDLAAQEDALPFAVRRRGRAIVLWANRNVRLSPFAVRVCDGLAAVQSDPTGSEDALSDLREALAPYRVTSRSAHEVGARMRNGYHSALFLCRETPVWPRTTFSAGGPIAPGPSAIREARMLEPKPMDSETLRRIRVRYGALVAPMVVCVILAALHLWSRGCESPTALFLGLTVAVQPLSILLGDELLAGQFRRNLWLFAASNPLGGLAGSIVGIASTAAQALVNGFGGLCVAAAFVTLCWPDRTAGSRPPVLRLLRFVGKTLAVGLVVGLFQYVLLAVALRIRGAEVHVLWIEAFLRVAVLSLVGGALRRRRAARTEVPLLDWRFPAVWLCTLLPFRLFAVSLANGGDNPIMAPLRPPFGLPETTALSILCLGCALAAIVLFVQFCLRTGFLVLLTPGKLAIAVITIVIPTLSEAVNGIAAEILSDTVFLSSSGNKLLGILFTVFVMARFWDRVEEGCRRMLVPGLRGIEDRVRRTLESALTRMWPGGLRADLDETMRAIGVDRWAFYRRTADDAGALEWQDGSSSSAQPAVRGRLPASPHLLAGLGGFTHVIDLRSLALSPRLFFLSFEVRRLMGRIRADQLLPVSLGRSFRGFLATFAPGRNLFDRDDVATELNNVALELVRSGETSWRAFQ